LDAADITLHRFPADRLQPWVAGSIRPAFSIIAFLCGTVFALEFQRIGVYEREA
jgi:hypothetical protein